MGVSDLGQFEDALGQFLLYKLALFKKEPERTLFLAVPSSFFESFFDDPFFLEAVNHYDVKMVIFEEKHNKIKEWKR
jgi:hypothetical protein